MEVNKESVDTHRNSTSKIDKTTQITNNIDDDVIDLKRYFILIYHYKWIPIISACLLTLLAVLYSLRIDESYTSSFSIYYEDAEHTNSSYGTVVKSNLDIQYWDRVIESDRLMALVQETSGYSLTTEQLNEYFSLVHGKDAENILTINLTVPNPELMLPISKAFVTSLNALNINYHLSGSHRLNDYLNTQLSEKTTDLDSIEHKIMSLSSELNIKDITGIEQLKSIFENYKKQLKDVRIELSSVVATKDKIHQELSTRNDTLMQEVSFTEPLKVQLMNLHVDLAKSLTKYKESHPIVKGIRNNITQVELMLKGGFSQNIEIKNLTANPLKRRLYSDLINTEINEISLNAKIVSLEQVIQEFQKQILPEINDSGLATLLRKRELFISTIALLNSKIIDVEAALQRKSSSFILIDEPRIPLTPSTKPLSMFLLIGLVGGFGLGVVVVIGLDLIDNRIKLSSDFENSFPLTVLGVTRHRKEQHTIKDVVKVSYNQTNHIVRHEISEIRINVNQLVKNESSNLIAMISPSRNEGKTLNSFLLAQDMARSGKKVLLIDLDTYVAKLSRALQLDKNKGIQNYLFEDTTLKELIVPLEATNLDFIGTGTSSYNNPVYYHTLRFNNFVKEIRELYDIVIFDTPALLYIPEIINFLEKVDGIIFISKINQTTRLDMNKIIKKTNTVGTAKIGAILTDVKENPLDKYYNNNYYYDYKCSKHNKNKDSKIRKLRLACLTKNNKRAIASILLLILLFVIPNFVTNMKTKEDNDFQIYKKGEISIQDRNVSDTKYHSIEKPESKILNNNNISDFKNHSNVNSLSKKRSINSSFDAGSIKELHLKEHFAKSLRKEISYNRRQFKE